MVREWCQTSQPDFDDQVDDELGAKTSDDSTNERKKFKNGSKRQFSKKNNIPNAKSRKPFKFPEYFPKLTWKQTQFKD